MEKLIAALLISLGVSAQAGAADVNGKLNFTATIRSSTCSLLPSLNSNASVSARDVSVDMGKMEVDSLMKSTINRPVFSKNIIMLNGISIYIKCSSNDVVLVNAYLQPQPGSVFPDGKTLKVSGGATGVGIALYSSVGDTEAWTLQNKYLAGGAGGLDGLIVPPRFGAEVMRFAPAYVRTGGELGAGEASAVLPFVLESY